MTNAEAQRFFTVWSIFHREEYFGLFSQTAKYAILVNLHRLAPFLEELRMIGEVHEQQIKAFMDMHYPDGVDEILLETSEEYRANLESRNNTFIQDNPLLENWLNESLAYEIYQISLADLAMLAPEDEVFVRETFPEIFNDLIV